MGSDVADGPTRAALRGWCWVGKITDFMLAPAPEGNEQMVVFTFYPILIILIKISSVV